MAAPASEILRSTELRGARQVGTLYRDGAVVVIREAVLEAILEFSEQDLTRERGGFLLGSILGESPQYVVVRHFHPALEAKGSLVSLTFNHETWASLNREIETRFPANRSSAGSTRIQGWVCFCRVMIYSFKRISLLTAGKLPSSSIRGGRSLVFFTGGRARCEIVGLSAWKTERMKGEL